MKATHTISAGALTAGLAVALGAFGAHGLEDKLEASNSVATWETAVRYQVWHGLALVALGLWRRERAGGAVAAWAFLLGTVLFSGSLYGLALELPGKALLGPLTPVGGLALLLAWALFARSSMAWQGGPQGEPR